MNDWPPVIVTNDAEVITHHAKWIDYGRLMRLPLVFSAIADVTMGFLFVHEALSPIMAYVATVVSSCCLYCAGMVLNDIYDLEQDRRERPTRVLPSGRIDLVAARRLGYGLLLTGIASGWLAGGLSVGSAGIPWRSGVVATVLALAVWLYDAYVKRSVVGPWVMGSCRGLNVLLGMSLAGPAELSHGWLGGYSPDQLLVALAFTIYVAGITWLARTEASAASSRARLSGAVVAMAVGWGLLAAWPQLTASDSLTRPHPFARTAGWPFFLLALGFPLLRQSLMAIARPIPAMVQRAVRQALLSIVVLDAAVCGAVRTPVWYAVGILALLIPASILRRWIEIT